MRRTIHRRGSCETRKIRFRSMRALILSDIHSGLEALEAVLAADIEFEVVWNLGDTVGYGANPNEVIDGLRTIEAVSIRGNHDRACSSLEDMEDFSPVAALAVEWTRRVLTPGHRKWLEELPAGPIAPRSPGVVCVHGSPVHEDEYLVRPEDAFSAFHANQAAITFFGHTHKQVGFAYNHEDLFEIDPVYCSDHEPDEYEMPLRRGFRYLLNPGSVGQPRDGDRRAAFALYDDTQALFTWHRVPYNISKTQASIRRAGLPDFLADRLSQGR